MSSPEVLYENDCPLCPVIGIGLFKAGQVYRMLSLRFSIPLAEAMSRNHDLIRVEPDGLREWLRSVKIDAKHIDHIPPDIQHGIMVTLPNGLGRLLVDGNHRAARALREGTHFYAAVLNEKETRRLLRLTTGRKIANHQWKFAQRLRPVNRPEKPHASRRRSAVLSDTRSPAHLFLREALAVVVIGLRVGVQPYKSRLRCSSELLFLQRYACWGWSMEICPVCGDIARFGVDEVIWELREVVVSACCDANLKGWLDAVNSLSRSERAAWMFRETGVQVRDILASGDVLTWTLDYGLHLVQVSLADAKNFIREHHRHCEPPVGWKYGAAVLNGGEMIGVMTAGRPVSAELAR